jgi:hypothetical protein
MLSELARALAGLELPTLHAGCSNSTKSFSKGPKPGNLWARRSLGFASITNAGLLLKSRHQVLHFQDVCYALRHTYAHVRRCSEPDLQWICNLHCPGALGIGKVRTYGGITLLQAPRTGTAQSGQLAYCVSWVRNAYKCLSWSSFSLWFCSNR